MSAPASASSASSTKRTRSSRSARSGVEDDGAALGVHDGAPTRGPGRGGAARAGTAAARRAPPARRRRCAPARRRRGRARRRVGAGRDDRGSRRGRSAAAGPRSPRKRAVRASRRPKTSCTTLRATCVATTRSVGAWKVPTLSAREWRSAVLATLGANGSCTWQRSSAARSKRSEIVRATSIGSAGAARGPAAAAAPRRRRGRAPRRARARASPARTAWRDSRTSAREDDGATTRTRCPRARELVGRRAPTKVLTSWRSSHG